MVDKYKETVLEGNGSHHNLWFEYIRYTACTLTKDNFVVCSQGRANLFMWPIPYLSKNRSLHASAVKRCKNMSNLPIFRKLSSGAWAKATDNFRGRMASIPNITFPDCFLGVNAAGQHHGNLSGNCGKIWVINHTQSATAFMAIMEDKDGKVTSICSVDSEDPHSAMAQQDVRWMPDILYTGRAIRVTWLGLRWTGFCTHLLQYRFSRKI